MLANGPPVAVPNYLDSGGQLVYPGTLPTTFDLDLLALVTDPEGDPLEMVSATPADPNHQLVSNGDGTYRLTVDPSFSGPVFIHFVVREQRVLPGGGLPGSRSFDVTLQVGEGGGTGSPPSPPAAPTGLTAALGDPGPVVELAWRDNSTDEDGFTVWRAVGAAGFQPHLSAPVNGESAVDNLVTVGVTYHYYVEAFNVNGSSVSETVTITVTDVRQSPFRGEPYPMGSRSSLIQVEDYDLGGNGVSYFDTTPGNVPGFYRADDVDLMHVYNSPSPAKESNVAVTNIDAGEWLEYSLSVEDLVPPGFLLRARNGSGQAGFHIEIDGTDISGPEVLPATEGGYRYLLYGTSQYNNIGPSTLRLVFDTASAGVAVDWLRFDQFKNALDSFATVGQTGVGTPLPGQPLEHTNNPGVVWEGSSQIIKKENLVQGQDYVGMDVQSDAVATIPIEWSDVTIAGQAYSITIDAQVEPGGVDSWVGVGFTDTPAGAFYAEPTPERPQGHGQAWVRLSGDGSYAVHLRGDSQTLATGSRPLESSGPTSVRLEMSGITTFDPLRLKVWIDHFLVCCDPGIDLETLVPGWGPHVARAGFHLHQRSGEVKVDDFYIGASSSGSVDPPGPIAVDDDLRSVGINEDGGPVVLEGVLDNDVPPLLVTITGAQILAPTNGSTVSVGAGGRSLVYTPGPDFAGVQQISYTIVDDQGSTDSGIVTVSVTAVNDPPVALMSLSCGGFSCVYDGGATFDVDNTQAELAFDWRFGDGGTSNLIQGTHFYLEEGSYPISLTATDPALASDTTTVNVVIDPAPVASFQVDCFDLLCTFDGSGSTRDGVHPDGLSFDWDFGDGSTQAVSAAIVVHQYSSQAVYLVNLGVTDAGGQIDTAAQFVDLDYPPVAAFSFDCLDLTCTFDASSSSSDSVSFTWDFGDGSPSATGSLVEHTFPTDGTFTVALTVKDGGGQADTTSQTLEAFDELLFLLLHMSTD